MIRKLFLGCLSVIVVVVLAVFIGGYLLTREEAPKVEKGSYLVLDLAGGYPEEAPQDLWTQVVEGRPLTVLDILEDLRKARLDDRIAGVLMRLNILSMGYGKAQEIRGALQEFKDSGKRVVSYIEMGRDLEYYLATAADEVYMAPVSALMVDGIVANAFFLRGSFDLLGIRPNFVRIGDYKTAVDFYTEKQMSQAYRTSINSILDSVFSRYVTDVSQARGLSEEQMRGIIDRGLLDSRQALEAGLVDDLLYWNQLEGKLKGEAKELNKVDAESYRDVDPARLGIKGDTKFALVTVEGLISLGGSGEGGDFGKIAGSSTIDDALKSALEDDEIKAIILRIDSPGGVSVAADLVWGELMKVKETKPVVVSMSDVAASGGYYIAMPADAIVAEPGTLTGSIGVYVGKFNLSGLYSKIGLNKETVKRGESADLFSETKDFSPEERDKLYKNIWGFYWNDFVMKAHEGRNLTAAFVDSVGRGRVWTGEQAFELGLVDALGGIWEAVDKAKELAEIPPETEVTLVPLPRPKGLMERFLEGDLVVDRPGIQLPPQLREAAETLQWMDLLGSGQVMAMMPYRIEFE